MEALHTTITRDSDSSPEKSPTSEEPAQRTSQIKSKSHRSNPSKRLKVGEGEYVEKQNAANMSFAEMQSRREAIVARLKEIKQDYGMKMPAPSEHPRNLTAQDYLLREMEWMASDFDRERRLKVNLCRKIAKSTHAHCQRKAAEFTRSVQETERKRRRLAGHVSKLVSNYWAVVEKFSNHFRRQKLEEKLHESRQKKLDKLVDKQLRLTSEVASTLYQDLGPLELNFCRTDDGWRLWNEQDFAGAAALQAKAAEPTGFTLATTKVITRVPFLLKHKLREYQHIGLDWLIALHDKKLSGILADEMGLGKTIQTIALIAYLACYRNIWGPHLIVVPTTLILNWEKELKRWCPGLKVLSYYGSQKERKAKRVGWSKHNTFHVVITSYKLAVQDQFAFKRKVWYYMVLDEAQHLKNYQSQRWQTLLKFNAKRRLLLTGTPLQNDVMELWSLLHFMMPQLFTSHDDFAAWFSNPLQAAMSSNTEFNSKIIDRLHSILRPFILRRMKKDVEKQLPNKIEHVVMCPLSRRQQFLYDEFLEHRGKQFETDSVGIMNVLMQLRKVCNHPDLFSPREVESPFLCVGLRFKVHPLFILEDVSLRRFVSLGEEDFITVASRLELVVDRSAKELLQEWKQRQNYWTVKPVSTRRLCWTHPALLPDILPKQDRFQGEVPAYCDEQSLIRHTRHIPVYSAGFLKKLTVPLVRMAKFSRIPSLTYLGLSLSQGTLAYKAMQKTLEEWVELRTDLLMFQVIPPKVQACGIKLDLAKNCPLAEQLELTSSLLYSQALPLISPLRPLVSRRELLFPDRRSVEHDCGKLRHITSLLKQLRREGHRCIIFTQMARMLDIMEKYLNLHDFTYVRLDGNTKVEQRQRIVDRFNLDVKVFAFISSTRSGGLGINLVGADTVIFYDTDWNPAMDKQAQDRCHRIGQTRDVHIYRLISAYTIEENILKKALQKRHLDNVIMEGGQFNTEFFQKVKVKDFFAEIDEEGLEAACLAVEDAEDVIAMKQAANEEAEGENEFDEPSDYLAQLDPVTRRAVEIYEELNPEIEEEVQSQGPSQSEEEEPLSEDDLEVVGCEDAEGVYRRKLGFLEDHYNMY
jgi:E1A-binding protein p400